MIDVEWLIVGSFITRMTEYMNSSQSNTIFTDDLKSAICLAETDDDIDVTLQMTRRFDVFIRLLYYHAQSLLCIPSCTTNFSRLQWTFLQPFSIWNKLPTAIKESNTLATFIFSQFVLFCLYFSLCYVTFSSVSDHWSFCF